MTESDKKQFYTLMGNVYAFYRQDTSSFALGVWWEAMKSFDFAAVADALNRHCVNPDSGQFMPKPADVVKMLRGSTLDGAMMAWSKVDKAIRQVGTYASVAFDDPVIHRVLQDMGGWMALGSKDEREWPFVAKEFETRYRGYRVRSEIPEYPKVLIGIAEAQNNQNGLKSQPPVLIGNSETAKRVLLGASDKPAVGFERLGDAEMLALAAPRAQAA
ncbi:DUF6475 domain-containing protein [Candidimonas nitroreducens]|uniref:DUF6475 domain-containing protein n=1 Tax=Candidimonas nitroreducens TaxID=683354 RepID=A0A225MLF4_9BURK|nr:DUF6475 domain-containing protein [Candidimonas nitroreducens]OWT62005.1 hypothetical protein CEY11_09360 [Candidimonas nitroreducens]